MDSVPAGDLVGSVVVIWPASMNGRAGSSPAATWPSASVMSATPSAMCTVPGALAGWLCQGTGPLSAQSTLIVDGSSWKARMPRRTRRGRRPVESRSSYSCGATTVATTARRASTSEPSAVCTVRARPPAVPMCSTGAGAADLATEGAQPSSQRLGELAGAALGDREADGLAHHAHQQGHQARAGGVEGDVGVAGVAGEQDPRRLAAEAVAAEVGGGGEQRPDELQPARTRAG